MYLIPQPRSARPAISYLPPRRRRVARGLGDALPWYFYGATGGAVTPGSQAEQAIVTGSQPASDQSGDSWFIPGSSLSDILYNALPAVLQPGGPLTTAQKTRLVQQQTADLVKSGMDPAKAAAQAKSDVATTTTQTPWEWVKENWPWLAIGGVGTIILVKEL